MSNYQSNVSNLDIPMVTLTPPSSPTTRTSDAIGLGIQGVPSLQAGSPSSSNYLSKLVNQLNPQQTRFENHSSLCSVCRSLRQKCEEGNINSPVDIGHWDVNGNIADAHKRRWTGKLRSIVKARKERLKARGLSVGSLGARGFDELGNTGSAPGKNDDAEVSDHDYDANEFRSGGVFQRPHEYGGELGMIAPAALASENQHHRSHGTKRPMLLDDSEFDIGRSGGPGVAEEGMGEPLTAAEMARLEELQMGSEMSFFGRYQVGLH